jgi:hypothetical protein
MHRRLRGCGFCFPRCGAVDAMQYNFRGRRQGPSRLSWLVWSRSPPRPVAELAPILPGTRLGGRNRWRLPMCWANALTRWR